MGIISIIGLATPEVADEIRRLREENARLKAEVKKLRRYHEALLDTLAASKSSWIQGVWRNAKSAYTGINYGDRGGPAEWGE